MPPLGPPPHAGDEPFEQGVGPADPARQDIDPGAAAELDALDREGPGPSSAPRSSSEPWNSMRPG
ncbi:hypothetical protein [Nonomuraea recticatena]|uniref:hypothetical protein n=1 Tax=Nonomuraea recticatena TaxID=46178 RepID=UPI00360B8AC0